MTDQQQTVHQQIANFIGAKLQDMDIKVAEMANMTTALNWLQGVANGQLQIIDLSSPDAAVQGLTPDEAAADKEAEASRNAA